jgi:hypothetical protein
MNTREARPSALEEYQSRLEARQAVVAACEATHARLAFMRLAIFAAAGVLAWLSFGRQSLSPLWLLVPLGLFVGVAIWHDRVLIRRDRVGRAVRFYERGLSRLSGTWPGTGATGERFLQPDHPYAADLDLFGHGSLFELLTTARIRSGEEVLARWLLTPGAPADLRARHEAIGELTPRLDFREDLALLGERVDAAVHPDLLVKWGAAPRLVTSRWPQVIAAALAILALVTLGTWAADWTGPLPFLLVAIGELICGFAMRGKVRAILASVEDPARDLGLLAQVFERFETESFTTPRLRALTNALVTAGHPPSRRIAQLQRLIDLLNSRQNQIFAPVAAVTLWNTQVALAVERWRAVSGGHLGLWLETLGELEALCSLAGYAYEHPIDVFPGYAEEGAVFEGDGVAHPLIPEDRGVRNTVHLGGETRMLLVSGSNMSGKSTLLRTVGVNTVLALAGAPVRADRLRVSRLAVGATLRVQDSLLAGQSRFYAEITRVRAVVALTAGPLPVLFLLDELLSGTNSHDRQQGAEAIVRGLLDRGAIGLVTTHDLALSAIADRLAPRTVNVHFADELDEGTLRFDYRMRPGVVRTSNAIALMRAVGLDV